MLISSLYASVQIQTSFFPIILFFLLEKKKIYAEAKICDGWLHEERFLMSPLASSFFLIALFFRTARC